MNGWREWPTDEQSEAELARRPTTVHDDDDGLVATAADPIAIVEWQLPIDNVSTEQHDVGAFRRDEFEDVRERPTP